MMEWVILLGLSLVQSSAELSSLERSWGLSPVTEKYQHPLESLKIETDAQGKRRLVVSNWYEDLTITKEALPDRKLYCRFMHSFLYGRSVVRSQAQKLPPQQAFESLPAVDSIRFVFFSILYRNQPTSPFWDKSPAPPPAAVDPQAKLRVTWKREESAVPYLSMEVSRAQWKTVHGFLKDRPYYSYSNFRKDLCESIFKIMPPVKSDFAALDQKDL